VNPALSDVKAVPLAAPVFSDSDTGSMKPEASGVSANEKEESTPIITDSIRQAADFSSLRDFTDIHIQSFILTLYMDKV
jgi:hypothetical protein